MPACNLIIDSCCDLPYEMVHKPGITLLEFPYFFGDEEFRDDLWQNMPAKEFYDRMRAGATPTTAQLPMTRLIDCYEKFADSDLPTIYLSFTSGLSQSYNVACMAANQVRAKHPGMELHVVDTLMPSTGEALVIAQAIKQWESGLSAQELEDWMNEARWVGNVCFIVDDLFNLARGGRMPSSIAYAGTKLKLKPMLYIDKNGAIATYGVARGRKKAIAKLVETMERRRDPDSPYKEIVVEGCDCPEDVNALAEELAKAHPEAEVITGEVGPTIGTHEGPGALNLAFWGQDRRNDK